MSSTNNVINNITGNYTLITTSSVATTVASIIFNNLTNAYPIYQIIFSSLGTSTANQIELQLSTNNGTSFDSGSNYNYVSQYTSFTGAAITYLGSTNATSYIFSNLVGTGNVPFISGKIIMYNMGVIANQSFVTFGQSDFSQTSGNLTNGMCVYTAGATSSTGVNAIRIIASTSTLAGPGQVYLYGLSV